MELRRKLGAVAVMAIVACTGVALATAGTAAAKGGVGGGGGGGGGQNVGGGGGGGVGGGGGGGLGGGGGGLGGGGGGGGGRAPLFDVTDNCGGVLDFNEKVAGSLVVTLTEPSATANGDWSLKATQQEYNVTTGGRVGDPIDLGADVLPPLAFVPLEGFTTSVTIDDTPNATHGFSYVATLGGTSPLTCTAEGFWTDHDGSTTPDPLNPTGKPDTAPAPTGTDVAHNGTNAVSVEFDQEMLATGAGIADPNRFDVTVAGVLRNVTAVSVVNDSPPNKADVTLTVAGDPLPIGATVSVEYRQPLLNTGSQLQDLDSLPVATFGPAVFSVS
jgi:hypothetical protein